MPGVVSKPCCRNLERCTRATPYDSVPSKYSVRIRKKSPHGLKRRINSRVQLTREGWRAQQRETAHKISWLLVGADYVTSDSQP